MRILFNKIHLIKGEVTLVRESSGVRDPGVIRVNVRSNSSIFNVMRDLFLGGAHHVYVIALSRDGYSGVYRDNDSENMTWILTPGNGCEDSGFLHETVVAIRSELSALRVPIDVIVGTCPVSSRASQMSVSWKRSVATVSRFDNGFDGSKATRFGWMAVESRSYVSMIAGALIDSGLVFLSEPQRRDFIREYTKCLSPVEVAQIISRSRVIRNPINLDDLDGRRIERVHSRTVGSFYRLTELKGTVGVLRTYAKMFAAGMIDQAVVTTAQNARLCDFMSDVPAGFEFVPMCDRDVYFQMAQRAFVAVYDSKIESDPMVPVELAYLGVVPILPDRQWARSAFRDWPLVFRSHDDAVAMVRKIVDSPNEYERYAALARAHVRENCAATDIIARFQDVMAGEMFAVDCFFGASAERIESAMSGKMADLKKKKTVSWEDALSVKMPSFGGVPAIYDGDKYQLLLRSGFVDDYSQVLPTLQSLD